MEGQGPRSSASWQDSVSKVLSSDWALHTPLGVNELSSLKVAVRPEVALDLLDPEDVFSFTDGIFPFLFPSPIQDSVLSESPCETASAF